jgi:hypothetical protein
VAVSHQRQPRRQRQRARSPHVPGAPGACLPQQAPPQSPSDLRCSPHPGVGPAAGMPRWERTNRLTGRPADGGRRSPAAAAAAAAALVATYLQQRQPEVFEACRCQADCARHCQAPLACRWRAVAQPCKGWHQIAKSSAMLRQRADQLAARLLQAGGQGQARAAVIVSATSHSGASVSVPRPLRPLARLLWGLRPSSPASRGGRTSWAFHPGALPCGSRSPAHTWPCASYVQLSQQGQANVLLQALSSWQPARRMQRRHSAGISGRKLGSGTPPAARRNTRRRRSHPSSRCSQPAASYSHSCRGPAADSALARARPLGGSQGGRVSGLELASPPVREQVVPLPVTAV